MTNNYYVLKIDIQLFKQVTVTFTIVHLDGMDRDNI